MRLLLDTHVLIWCLMQPHRLAPPVRAAIEGPQNEVALSAVVAWELAIKSAGGKLKLSAESVRAWLLPAIEKTSFTWIPITMDDALRTEELPWHHRDPFDRLLIAQALGGYTLVTHDRRLAAYGAPLLWAN